MKFQIIFIILCSSLLFPSLCRSDIYVIAHKNSAIQNLNLETLKEIYLGNRQYINELRVLPLDQDSQESTRQQFYQDIIQKPQGQLISHWSRLIFTGKGQAPIALSGDQSIVNFVSNNPNVIGYINKKFISSNVKIIYQSKI